MIKDMIEVKHLKIKPEYPQEKKVRIKDLNRLMSHYTDFRDFYADVSEQIIGFTPTPMQYDIARFIAEPNWDGHCIDINKIMVQAQRGEAKTTITACFAVWVLIHRPKFRILIVSAGGKMAKEIANWCIQIINGMSILECMKGDKSHAGTMTSVEAYMIHHELRGPEKSPSIKCMGVTAQIQGSRADILIADDVESGANSKTETLREGLRAITRDFISICSIGRIIYLGTPQTRESIYNELPARGYTVRVWSGRVPTVKQRPYYGNNLAPMIQNMIDTDPDCQTGYGGDSELGAPTDPGMFSDDVLLKKEMDQGKAYFTLQHMLNTSMSDEERYPLKIRNLLFVPLNKESVAGNFTWTESDDYELLVPSKNTLLHTESFYKASYISPELFEYERKILSIDPGGGGQHGDETGYSALFSCNGFICLMENGGIKGGTEEPQLLRLLDIMVKWGIKTAVVEQNYGHGMYRNALIALARTYEYTNDKGEKVRGYPIKVVDVYSAGMKEDRIIDALEPVLGIHKLLINLNCIQEDYTSTIHYREELRNSYQFLYQLSRITRDKGSLKHDDRLESLSQGVTYLEDVIKVDAKDKEDKKIKDKMMDFLTDPNGLFSRAHAINNLTNRKPLPRKPIGGVLDRFHIRTKKV